MLRMTLTLALALAPLTALATDDASVPETIEFNRDVRQILADNCFACHAATPAARTRSQSTEKATLVLRPDISGARHELSHLLSNNLGTRRLGAIDGLDLRH